MGSEQHECADRIADQLRAAGFVVERKDYEAFGDDSCGARSYVVVTDEQGSRVEGQINERNPGRFSGYGGPNGKVLLDRVRAVVGDAPWEVER